MKLNTLFLKNGFTLIEVMIALSVVAIGLMAILKAMNEEVGGAVMIQNKMIALWMLENKIAEIHVTPTSIVQGVNQGKQTLYNQTWLWQTETLKANNERMQKINVSILIPNPKGNELLLKQAIYLGNGK
jgi:general secretion pathway protein I